MLNIEWIENGVKKGAITIIVGYNKLFHNQYPIYIYSQEEMNDVLNYLNNNDDNQISYITLDLLSIKYKKPYKN